MLVVCIWVVLHPPLAVDISQFKTVINHLTVKHINGDYCYCKFAKTIEKRGGERGIKILINIYFMLLVKNRYDCNLLYIIQDYSNRIRKRFISFTKKIFTW